MIFDARALCSVLIAACFGFAAAAEASDFMIEPGRRAGPVTKDTTEAQLKALLPKRQVRRVLMNYGENYYACATEIFAGTPHAAFITWASMDDTYIEDSEANRRDCLVLPLASHPQAITLRLAFNKPAPSNSWHTKDGVRLGASIRDLELAAGGPFEFSVSLSEPGGSIVHGSAKIASSMIVLRLDFPEDAYIRLKKVIKDPGGLTVSSSDVPKEMLRQFAVRWMRVSLDPDFFVAKPLSDEP